MPNNNQHIQMNGLRERQVLCHNLLSDRVGVGVSSTAPVSVVGTVSEQRMPIGAVPKVNCVKEL